MKIIVLSDIHFGYAPNREQERDPYRAVAEVIERSRDADLILIPGDIFDMKIPSPETLANAMEMLAGLAMGEQPNIVKMLGGKEIKNHPSTRVVAIHGTHERRARELVNPVQILEKAGFLVHLDRNGIVLEKGGNGDGKNGEKVAIQALGGVPDQYTEKELRAWGPKPEPGCFNIFMLHQNMTEFMPSQVEHTLDKDKLPPGFDLYLNGHIHRPEQSTVHARPLIICGSLVHTQIVKEAEKPLGFWSIDTSVLGTSEKPAIEFMPLEKQRRVVYTDMESPGKEDIEKEIAKAIETGLGEDGEAEKPIIKINIKGKPVQDGKKAKQFNLYLKEIKAKFGDKAIISFRHEFGEQPVGGKTLEQHKLSVHEMGEKLLDENLKEYKLDPQLYGRIFELLLHGKQEDVLKLLENPEALKEYKTEDKPEIKKQTGSKKPEKTEKQDEPVKTVKQKRTEKPHKTGTGLGRFF